MANRQYKVDGFNTRPKRYRLIKNSATIKVGDWLNDASSGAQNASSSSQSILGLATAICRPDKTSFESATVTTGSYGGTWTASSKQYVAASDNQTVDGILVEYIPVREGDEFVATLSQAKGTTTGSDKEGYFIAISASDSSKLDETTASTSSTNCAFRISSGYPAGSTTEIIVEVIVRGEE